MLKLDHIRKAYVTNAFTQIALDDVSLAFRDNEFVSILGPSGSGKTTLLNVVGGLDHFDAGDLIIDGVSTKDYRDRDWDAYRNNRIGFVFQSYNLIPHQTILANVELALTLSGVSPAERRERARKALADVGLGKHVDKRPSQLSGGQMQRVAIARALINDPEILLADEPTGALDSHTSVQVMDLLREVAADRLVIMVTHNPELAHQYSTRIVELADGQVRSDSDPYMPTDRDLREAKPPRRTSMGFLTALSLSFNNLMTKKGRTLMTAFAGSIGIIGIAAILSLANGVNAYIKQVEEDALSAYPLQIMSSGLDLTSMLVDTQADTADTAGDESGDDSGAVGEQRMVTSMFGSVGKNDLAALKKYFDGNGGNINAYVQDIEYLYGVVPQVFDDDTLEGVNQVNPDKTFAAFGMGGSSSAIVSSSSAFSTNVFHEMPNDLALVEDRFDVKAGRWPKAFDELVLVLSRSGKVSDFVSYALGLRSHGELEDLVEKLAHEEDYEVPTDERAYSYDELMSPRFKVVPASSMYVYEPEYGVWTSKADDEAFMKGLVDAGQQLRIVGVIQPKEDADATSIGQGIYYMPELTRWLMDEAAKARIVQDQLDNPNINVVSGKSFDIEAQEQGPAFDMSKLFSLDENKLASAFTIDPNALNLEALDMSRLGAALDFSSLGKSMDLSSLPAPEIDASQLSLPDLDLSGIKLDLSSVDLSGVDVNSLLTPEVMAALTPALSTVDPTALFEGVTPQIAYDRLAPAIAEAQQGFGAYVLEQRVNPQDAEAMQRAAQDYFSRPEVQARLGQAVQQSVTFTDADRQRIADNLRTQLAGAGEKLTDEQKAALDTATQQVVDGLAQQVGNQVADQVSGQLAAQLTTQLSSALAQALTTVISSYLEQALGTYMANVANVLQNQLGSALTSTMQGAMGQLMSNMASAFHFDESAFAEAFSFNMDERELAELMSALMSSERTSYENNLVKFGYANEDKPSEIDIYPSDFEAKDKVIAILDAYNERMRENGDEDKVITYTDFVGELMSSVTDIINKITYVLIAFVAISLVVSSIMIGVITYISVLERKKEIGILRSIGASKRDISRVFNAETIIEGLVSGLMGVGITALVCVPVNILVEAVFDVDRIARLPLGAAAVLIGVSVSLSFIAGLLPSRKAAKADPVEALRSE